MNKDYDVVFLGGLFPKEYEQEILNYSVKNIQNAANVLQWNLVTGLDLNLDKPTKIINSLYVGSYPKLYKKLFIETFEFSHCKDSKDINVGFINLWGIKNYLRYYSLKKYLKEWAIDGSKNKVIVAYAMTQTFCRAIEYIKKINPLIKTLLVVPDLPLYMNLSNKNNSFYDFLKKIDIYAMNNRIKYIDYFVFLTEYMSGKVNIYNKPYIVIEGIVSKENENDQAIIEKFIKKTIAYTGTLNEKYGIKLLVDAFMKVEIDNAELIICGNGDSEEYIKDISFVDNRIKYLGAVSREESILLQRKATLLVNPRPTNEEYTKYSFPSKNMEYMLSGTPVLTTKLPGMPDEYYDYVYLIDDESVDGLTKTLTEVLEKSNEEMYELGIRAKNFVLKAKNSVIQTKKIIDMLSDIIV